MNPNLQMLLGYIIIGICAIFGFMGGIMVKQGYDKKKEQVLPKTNIVAKKEPAAQSAQIDQNKQNAIKIAEIKINRLIDDANAWVQERIEQNRPETDKLIAQFNARGVIHSGMHVAAHIDRVNLLLKNINDYIKDMNRKIEDEFLSLGEEKFETAVWLKDEFVKYQGFVKFSETAKNNLKSFNNEVCLRFADKSTFENILKSHPYKE